MDAGAGAEGGGDGSGPNGTPGGRADSLCGDVDVGPSHLARLTSTEYANTVRDLLGVEVEPSSLPADDKIADAFDSNSGAAIASIGVESHADLAAEVARSAMTDLDALVPCDPASGDRACAEEFVQSFGRRAYRRPLEAEEVERIVTVYDTASEGGGFEAGIRASLEMMLQSPNVLYRVEVGDGEAVDGVVRLSPHETAARLSYFVWDSTPDEELLALADTGDLADPHVVEAQVRRMLDDEKAERALRGFFRQWLRLENLPQAEKDPETYPEFTTTVAQQLTREAEALASWIVREGDGSFETLMTASFGFVSSETAEAFYGVEAPAAAEGELVRVELDPAQRSGLLTHPGLMALVAHSNQTSPVHRGEMVRRTFLCENMPPPPPGVDATVPVVDPSLPARERFNEHSGNDACAGCHRLMDPIGFGLESYDGIGRYRETHGDHPLDVSGAVVEMADPTVSHPFNGGVELAQWLAQSEQVQSCFVQQWLTYAHGRGADDADDCAFEAIARTQVEAGLDVNDVIVAIATSHAFLHRRLPMEDTDGE